MSETTRMHFVPRTYLKRFSTEKMKAGTKEYYISALDISKFSGEEFDTIKGEIKQRNIRRICVEDNLYLLPGETKEERLLIENLYQELYEDSYDALYKLLIDDKKDIITVEERYSIVGFVVSLFFRNNTWNNFMNRITSDIYDRAYLLSKANNQNSFFFEDKEISLVGKTLDELKSDNKKYNTPEHAMQTVQRIFELIRLRVNNDFISVIKARPGFEFITSDNPVSFKNHDISHRPIPFDPTNALWLPIDKDHMIQVQPWADQLDWAMIGKLNDGPFPGTMTSMSNNFQLQQCGKYLLGTENGLNMFQQKPMGIIPKR